MTVRILLATDGSDGARGALEQLGESFRPTEIEQVEVLSVVAPPPRWRLPRRETDPSVLQSAHRRVAEMVVSSATDRLSRSGFRATASIRDGHPAEEIAAAAAESAADLVILGSRGLTGTERLLAGSVSTAVSRTAAPAVLIAHGSAGIRRIVVGVDGSSAADAAIDLLADLPFREAIAITVVAAIDVPFPLTSGIAPAMLAEVEAAHHSDVEAAQSDARTFVADTVERLTGPGRSAAGRVLAGRPAEAIAAVAGEHEADLIVVGSRGLGGVGRLLLGSSSAALVANPPASVLIVRPPAID